MKLVKLLFLFLLIAPFNLLAQNPMNVATNAGGLQWNRLPSDAEIEAAVNNLINQFGGDISVNGDVVDQRRFEVSRVVKFHNKDLAGKREPGSISGAHIFSATYGTYGTTINSYSLVQNAQTNKFHFIGTYMGKYRPASLQEAYDNDRNGMQNGYNSALGFAPPMNGSSASDTTGSSVGDDSSSDDDIPWTVVIGGLSAAAVAAIVRKILKKAAANALKNKSQKTNSKKNQKDKKEEEEEEAHYVLQLNKQDFQLELNQPDTLEVLVYKITPTSQKKYPADIQIQSPEKALKIMPNSGVGSLNAQLLLQEQPKNQNFNIVVSAQADGHQFQKAVRISTTGAKNLVLETAPYNKKSLRPDTFQVLTCYARITDEKGNTIPDITQKIQFEPKSEWIDLSKPEWVDDNVLIYIGCSSPNPSKNLTPPKTVIVTAFMDEVAENEEPLQKDLEITLIDCQLETQIEDVTFPETDEVSEVTFWARIENAGEETGWNFSGEYRLGIDPTDPITDISIDKKNETEADITLRGPIVKLGESENQISKTLVISAFQGDEKPLERHITVIISREGLFIKHGANKNNEINFTAEKPIEEHLDFALNVYDEQTNQIVVDKSALQHLEFELLNEEEKIKNLVSVLKPEFTFMDLVTNVPYGKYKFTTQEDIPGVGEIFALKYKITAPVQSDRNPELFEKILTVNVRSYGVGKEFPDWVKAYEECLYVLNNYVPKGEPYNKLSALLESRKMTLGAEGLTELRNRMWRVASELILAEGAEGYKSEERWANVITTTLEWTEWAGDLAFNALAAFYLKGLGATGAGMVKAGMIEALNFYIYEPEKGWDEFADRQYQKIVPLLIDVTKGRLISVENIQTFVVKNKIAAWVVFISCEFLYNLYQTKSVVEAAKITAQQLRDEFIMRKLTTQLQKNALKYNLQFTTPDEVLNDLVKNIKTVNGEDIIDPAKVMEIMRDPAKVRTIKNHGTEYMKKVFEGSRKKIYEKHDAELKKYLAETYKLNPDEVKIDEFRTPGTDGKINLNTDRDYRVLRKVTTANGTTVWIELQTPNWKNKSYEIFGEITGKPHGIEATEWAERHLQRGTDRFDTEASKDYADNVFNEKTGEVRRNKPNIVKVMEGKGTLIDSEGLGKMYENKINNALEPGTVPEAYAQAKKGVHTLEEVHRSYKDQGLDVPEIPERLQKAMKVIEKANTDANANPLEMENLQKQLNDLEYKDLADVGKDMANSFKDLKDHDQKDAWSIAH